MGEKEGSGEKEKERKETQQDGYMCTIQTPSLREFTS